MATTNPFALILLLAVTYYLARRLKSLLFWPACRAVRRVRDRVLAPAPRPVPEPPPPAPANVPTPPPSTPSFFASVPVTKPTELKSNLLLRLHPFREMNIYNADYARIYSNLDALEPHLYRLCCWCHWKAHELTSQAIIMAGISGSGKTETFRNVLRYLKLRTNSLVIDRVLQTQELLRAFGSASTQKSASSTRFGQLLDLYFDFKGDVIEAYLTHLLLEKNRVTQRSRRGQERNFNIFYSFLAGAEIQLLKQLRLQRNRQNYALLRLSTGSDSSADSGHDAKLHFAQIKACLESMDLDEETICNIFQILAIILKAGNLGFKPSVNLDNTPTCIVQNEHDLADLVSLLNCSASALSFALVRKHVHVRGEIVCADLCADEAQANVDLLIRSMYSRLFHWLIGRVNSALKQAQAPSEAGGAGAAPSRILSVLDAYGFDDLELNTFEQLLINAVNERMHWFLVDQNLRKEQELYAQEGLNWVWLAYSDHSAETLNALCSCFSALDLRPVLNSPAPTHCEILEVIAEKIQPPAAQRFRLLSKTEFLVRHFITDVHYNACDFLPRNFEVLKREFCEILYQSSNHLCKILFPEGEATWSTLTKRLSTAAQFQISLNSVFRSLAERECSWIVCVKPNSQENPKMVEDEYITEQLRAFSIREIACLGQTGYSMAMDYQSCLNRYRVLSSLLWPRWRGEARAGVMELVRHLRVSPCRYGAGRTQIFFKDLHLIAHLENCRTQQLHLLASLIQRTFRNWCRTNRGDHLIVCQIRIATCWRAWRARVAYRRLQHSCIVLQAYVRGWRARKIYRQLRRQKAAKIIARCLWNHCRRCYLIGRSEGLPSRSPIDRHWSRVRFQLLFGKTESHIRDMYHRWRCWQYRTNMDQQEYFRMREKLTASVLLRDKKVGYDMTVAHPFRGDYVKIRQNLKWRKIATETNDEYVVFADIIAKVHRASGKVSSALLVLSTAGLVLLDPRSLQLKQRAPVQAVMRVSLSPYCDTVAVIHLRDATLSKNRGDFILECRHVVELVAKLYLVVQNATGKPPFVDISSNIWVACETEPLELVFKPMPDEDSGAYQKGCFLGGAHSKHSAPKAVKPSPSSPLLGCYDTTERSCDVDGTLPDGSPVHAGSPAPTVRYTRKPGRLEVHI